jgi:hypothetical protein
MTADVTVFDVERIQDNATFASPGNQPSDTRERIH